MPPRSPLRSGAIRVVLASTPLVPFMSVWKAAGFVVAQVGLSAFFIAGVTVAVLGPPAFWFVLGAVGLAALARGVDIENWALLIPGGLAGRVRQTFGQPAAHAANAATLVERLFLCALACLVFGHYMAAAVTIVGGWRFTGYVRPEDLATLLAIVGVGVQWIRVRLGRELSRETKARFIWIGIASVTTTIAWGFVTLIRHVPSHPAGLAAVPPSLQRTGSPAIDLALGCLLALGLILPVVGSCDVLTRAAFEFPPPRIRAVRRTARLAALFGLVVAAGGTLLFILLVPEGEQNLWRSAPLAGLTQYLAAPGWLRAVVGLALATAAAFVLLPAADAALRDAERMIHRQSAIGSDVLSNLSSRFGTSARAVDIAAVAVVLTLLTGGGRVPWIAKAYAVAVAVTLTLSVAALLRLRRSQRSESPGLPFKAPADLSVGRRRLPLGVLTTGSLVALGGLAMVVLGDVPSIASAATLIVVALWFVAQGRQGPVTDVPDSEAFDLLAAADLSLDQVEARPGNVLVAVRNPHALTHVAAALQAAGNRDIVAMTVRLADQDPEGGAGGHAPTRDEHDLLSAVVALAERYNRPVRLLIVPARSVVDAIVATAVRLRSSDIYVGESVSLSSADQARLIGEAWERADVHNRLDVRLVVHHRGGRSDTYHLGAHPPSLSPGDLELIHRLWLDAAKTIGPHVHHHDVVRAALTQMEQQLSGPQREAALASIRETARTAEELTALLQAHDYGRLRDMLRNRHGGDVAELLTELSTENQVVVFRVLPRKDAAAVFEYLDQDAKESLLKAMAQEDVAAILSNMAPDDRTEFLEELPAEVTRQLLSLLTPTERSVAVTLLGYPERTVGRLMTPNYVAVREHWTIREVLDHVRTHGQDSETLNLVYVVNDEGRLIDDIRIRELLLAPLESHVSDLMDRRFAALKATDRDDAAVAMFREYDRAALPVTDTAGVLIGIVTIDDVLDVAEATATRDIQRIGGSEAFDEPYIEIAFWRMIRKRAGWLTALFLGEMLTATAMGFFEVEISRAVVLALFVPLIISSGGNSGSQASTLVIRAIALGEVSIRDWWRVMRREVLAGLALGTILGSIGFLRITLWSAFTTMYGPHWLLVALTVAVSLVGVVLWGTLTGSLLPFLLKRLGFDPATSSAPFVATLVDVTGLVIYFSVAIVILGRTLLAPVAGS